MTRVIPQIARDPRIRLPIVYLLFVMAVLSLQRLLVLMLQRGRFADVPTADLTRGFGVGLQFDVWVACVLLVPLVAALAIARPKLLARQAFQNAVAAYCAAIGALLLFTCIADYYFFETFGERLNHKALDYLAYPVTYRLIWHDYPVIWAALGTLVFLAGLWWAFRWVGFPRRADGASVPRLVVWLVVSVPLLVIGIRGGVGPIAINTAPAYFSPALSLSQLTLNGPFTLREALVSRTIGVKKLGECLPLLPDEEAFALTRELLARPEDRFLNQPDNPLRRVTDTGRPQQTYNVVLVMMESLNWAYVGALGGEPDLTPNLNALADEGILMDHCFSVGCRTSRGMAGIISGYPDLPGSSATTRIEAENNFLTLGEILRRRGYETMFIYGGQPNFDHRRAFLGSNGFTRTIFEGDFESRTFRTMVGWCDEDLFNEAHRAFVEAGERPFFALLLTISFHRPFEVPPERLAQVEPTGRHFPEFTCVRYVDWTIRNFLDQARQAPYFDRTIFVFVADHRGEFLGRDASAVGYRVPFLIYAPQILGSAGQRVSSVCSQTDVAPTIMSLLGGQYEHCFFGSSVLDRPAEAGLALMQDGEHVLWLMAANGDAVQVPFGSTARLWRYNAPEKVTLADPNDPVTPARCEELRRQATALLQSATLLFERGSYHLADVK